MRRALVVVAIAAGLCLAGGSAYASWTTPGDGPGAARASSDWTAPSASAAVVVATSASAPGWLTQGDTYVVYATVSDSGRPASGVASVTADMSAVEAGATAVSLPACASACTAGGVTYGYKSAGRTSSSSVTPGARSFSIRASDARGNTATTSGFSVTVDNAAPAPTIASPAAGARLTNATVTYSGTAGSASGDGASVTVQVYAGSSASGSATQTLTATRSGSSWSVTAPSALADGTWTVQASQTDAAGNTGRSAPVTFTVDATAPTGSSVSGANGATSTSGKLDSGDVFTFGYTEAMDPASIVAGWNGTGTRAVSLTISDGKQGANDGMTVPGVGTLDLGSSGVVTGNLSFDGTLAMSVDRKTITLTVGACTTTGTNCTNKIGSGVGLTTLTWTPSSNATDTGGNPVSTTPVVEATAPKQNY